MRVNESGAGLPAGPGGSSHHYNRTSQINSSNLQNGKIAPSNHVNSTTPSNIPTLGSTSLPLRLPLGGLRTQGGPSRSVESPDHIENQIKQEPAPISVMTSDKRVYSRKVMEVIEASGGEPPTADFSQPPPGKITKFRKLRGKPSTWGSPTTLLGNYFHYLKVSIGISLNYPFKFL